jgi:hypothetical protein
MVNEMVRQDSVAVNAAAATMVLDTQQSSPRQLFYAYNSSTGGQVLTLVFGDAQTITSGKGIVLQPKASYSESISEGFAVWQGRIWAISDVIAGSLTYAVR